MKFYLGLDNGGTTTKAALFSQDGREIGVSSVATDMLTLRPGFTERDMEEMWEANCRVIRDLLDKTKADPGDILGIACCGHGKGLYLWGKDGRPVRNGIISTDNRAWEYPIKWREDGTEQKVFELTCQHILSCQPVSLLAWLKDNEPGTLEKIEWAFECKDYVRFRLTGEAWAEITDYSGANFLNLHTGKYDKRILALFGISEIWDALPPICLSMEICGYITEEVSRKTGLAAGTPVAGGMFDIDACALAVSTVDEEHVCMIAGTWSINEYIRKEPVLDGSVLMNSLYCLPGYYLIEECSPTSAGNCEWFIQRLLPELIEKCREEGKSIYDVMNDWVEQIPPDEFCPIFLPFLMASNVNPNAKAAFIGMSNFHTRAHLARSIYEGVVFSHKYHYDKLLNTRELPPKSIRLAGGVTHSGVWVQMFADILETPIEIIDVNESGAFGCAIACAVATGRYASAEDAVKDMCRVSNFVEPNKQTADLYRARYRIYLKLIEALDDVWKYIQEL
ncbi:MAG: carbohydrate kinase [Eubacteriales bacterium]|nr:carbohydrate kinase [Eubacteriales bacterium]